MGEILFLCTNIRRWRGTYFSITTSEIKENYKYSVEIPFKYEVDEEEFERKEDFYIN